MAAPDEQPAPQPTPPGAAIQTAPAPAAPETIKLPPPATPAPPSPAAFLRRTRALDAVIVAAVLVFAFLVALFPARNSDFLSHLAAGRMVAQGQYKFGEDPFSFGSQGAYWANHSWLYGLVSYALYQLPPVGPTLLIVLKALLVVALAEAMLRLARPAGRSLWIPAACTGLAVLALSPHLNLRPVVVSYLFLGLTLLLLETQRRREEAAAAGAPTGWDVRWLIPPLCALWVNLDAWFLLGPVTVGLYLLGEFLSAKAAPRPARAPARGGLGRLAAVLGVSVAACLVNPYHVHAFTLPAQLGLSPAGSVLADDDAFKRLFLSPLSEDLYFWKYTSLGLNVAGAAYVLLALVCVTSFALAGPAGLGWRATVTLPFLLLSLWHYRAIPFFAVVAGPVSALNFLDFAARQFGTDPWLEGPRRTWALGGRALTLAAAVLLAVCSWPGWLQPTPHEARRVGWDFQFDPDLEQAAREVARWRQEGRLADGPGWFNTTPETVVDYLAWYAPGERVFADLRLPLYDAAVAEEYASARRDLVASGAGAEGRPGAQGDAWRDAFRKWGVRYVFLADNDNHRSTAALLGRAKQAPEEWTVCELNGRALLLAWKDPRTRPADPPAAPRYDALRAAFGPGAEPAPPDRPAGAAEPREWYAALWKSEPFRSGPAERAVVALMEFEIDAQLTRQRWAGAIRPEAAAVTAAAAAALGASPGGPAVGGAAAWAVLSRNRDFENGFAARYSAQYQLGRDDGPPADLYLMIRATRRALAANPADARAYFLLAKGYLALRDRTRERAPGYQSPYLSVLRQTQALAALNQAVTLNPNDDLAHEQLFQLYQGVQVDPRQVGFADLCLKHAEAVVRIRREGEGNAPRGPDWAKDLERLEAFVKQLREQVDKRRDQYEIRSANRPGVERVRAALELGLAEPALAVASEEVRRAQPGADLRQVAAALAYEVHLLILTGRLAEAREHLTEEVRGVLNAVAVPYAPPGGAFDWYSALLAVASGDYAEADRILGELAARLKPPTANVAGFVATWWMHGASAAFGRPTLQPELMRLQEVVFGALQVQSLQAQMEFARAALALEAGDNAAAREQLVGLLTRTGHRGGGPVTLDFPGRPLAQVYLEWLDAAAR
jgi:hypothetical protein